MTGVSLVGPSPGVDVLQAQSVVLGELTDVPEGVDGMPALVQLPARGWAAEAVGRAAALLTEMPVELGPHGWRIADRPGREGERLRSQLREDLDALAIAAHGYVGPLTVPMLGPWALSSVLYLPRQDRVLGDRGAVRELIGSMSDGLADLIGSVRVAVPGAEPVVVLREPVLPDILRGNVRTFSGRERLRSVPGHDVGLGLAELVAAARSAGATRVVADGGREFSGGVLQVLAASGADGLGVGAASVGSAGWEQLAALVEEGRSLWFGLPSDAAGAHDDARVRDAAARDDPRPVARLVSVPWTAVGLPATGLADVVVHTDAGASGARAQTTGATAAGALRSDLRLAVRAAALLAERAAGG